MAGTAVAVVPEPETYALMLGGLRLVGGAVRRRRNSSAACVCKEAT
ncbi:MAG: PEPxxWA-CTERM sorting domain-containing protein [Thiobacillus sp.]|nr:PEPxxWA-CTERM sorting domain-containing protein [Thiobacillus sp.]